MQTLMNHLQTFVPDTLENVCVDTYRRMFINLLQNVHADICERMNLIASEYSL